MTDPAMTDPMRIDFDLADLARATEVRIGPPRNFPLHLTVPSPIH